MRCSKCGSDNRVGRKFCADCGASLAVTCAKCGASNQPEERFCGECGAGLAEAGAGKEKVAPIVGLGAGERRHLTVLFCDLVGSTEIAANLDPEEWREVVAGYHRAATEAITRFGGYVAQYLGDGVMAYFGWPAAHDNDGERAACAGLAILDAVLKLNGDATRPMLAARIGIDSGAVVIGAGANKDADVFGNTPNIAARLQAIATPGTVLITAATHRLISGLFEVEALGRRALKGIATSVEIFQVVRPTGVRGRVQAARGLTPFVGREEELRLLLSRWERAREGEGQLALVIGEAGIGKSRLVAEFHDRIRDSPHIWIESAGEQLFENTPLHAVSEMLSRWLELQEANSEERFQRIERALASAGLTVAEVAPQIAELLQLPAGERYSASILTAAQKRRRLLAALAGWVMGAAGRQLLVMVVEDLHWLDPSTLELLQLLADQSATVPLMLLYTARPEFRAPWLMRTHHTQITLNRLSSRHVREMVAVIAAHNALTSESVQAVVERTGGVPLFVEELTRAVLESGSAEVAGHEIPATLHDSLMARLDRLGPAKEVIQIGAVIGSEFSYELLHAVHPTAEEDLQGALRNATDAELVYVRGIVPDAAYQFKHALIQDVAYGALLRSRRKELHSRIAEVLVREFPDRVTSAPELLAHHYTEAGLIAQALSYWQQAGQRASQRSAYVEAIAHFTKGLELLKTLPDTPERAQYELTLQLAVSAPLQATQGWAAPAVERAYTRARELCRQVGETPQLFPVLFGLWAFYVVRAAHKTARELGEQLLTLAQGVQDPALLLLAHSALGATLFHVGEFASAREHMEQSIALYDPQHHRPLALLYAGHDPGVVCLCWTAHALWFLGYPDHGLQRSDEGLTLAQELAHPFSLAFALNLAAMIHQLHRERQLTQERAEAAIILCTDQGFPFWLASGTLLRGWALAEQGQGEERIRQISQGLAACRATGAGVFGPYFLALQAEAHENTDQTAEGLTVLAEALATVGKTGERHYEAELYRLKGQLTLQSKLQGPRSKVEEAEECFRKAIEIARRQQAKSLELRAVMNLARLWQQQGKKDEARQVLAEIYSWFTEGFDTRDLQEAKALLDELSA
jgi:class 3 adenylate cyclase/predicted ATPase